MEYNFGNRVAVTQRGWRRQAGVRGAQSARGPAGGVGCLHQRGWAGGDPAACGGLAAWSAALGRSPEGREWGAKNVGGGLCPGPTLAPPHTPARVKGAPSASRAAREGQRWRRDRQGRETQRARDTESGPRPTSDPGGSPETWARGGCRAAGHPVTLDPSSPMEKHEYFSLLKQGRKWEG